MAASIYFAKPLPYPVNGYSYNDQHIGSLRGSDSDTSTFDNFDLVNIDINTLKFSICRSMMSSCVRTVKKDRKCMTPGECSDFKNGLIIPITHGICGYTANKCDDTELNQTLQRLYDAGALSEDDERSKLITQSISELNDLKNNANIVKSNIHLEDARKAQEEKKFADLGISESKSGSEKTDQNLEKETEQEEAVV